VLGEARPLSLYPPLLAEALLEQSGAFIIAEYAIVSLQTTVRREENDDRS
jgi:hypothetical protein